MYGSLYECFAKGTNDPLFAKAVVLQQGQEQAALVVCDLCSVTRDLTVPARQRAAQRTGIRADNIVIMATHTHAGPEYFGVQRDLRHERAMREKGRDEHEPLDYLAQLTSQVTDVIVNAQKAAQPAHAELVRTQVRGLAFNRRFHMQDGSVVFNPGKLNTNVVAPAGATDPELPFLLLRRADSGQPVGSLTVFAMHVATFAKDHTWSADYPAVIAARFREKFGRGFISVFGEGAAGDVNHIDVNSAKPQPGDTEPLRIGNALADAILQKLPDPLIAPSLAARSATVNVPLVEITGEQMSRARDLLERTDRPGGIAFLLTVEAWQILNTVELRRKFGDSLPLEVNVIRLNGETALVCLPHEIFVELGLAIKRASPFKNTLVLSLAHDLDFYILTRRGYAEGGYEAITSSVKPGAGEALVETALKLLKELKL